MEKQELIKTAQKRLDAMFEDIETCITTLSSLASERHLVAYLLHLSQKENK